MAKALTEHQFRHALEELYDVSRESQSDVWREARVRTHSDGVSLVLYKKFDVLGSINLGSEDSDDANTANLTDHDGLEEQTELEEDYDAELIVTGKHSDIHTQQEMTGSVVWEIAYSRGYGVPVLYLDILPKRDIARTYERLRNLIPSLLEPQVRHVMPLGAVTMTDHPHTGSPVFFVHPCNTQAAMYAISAQKDLSPAQYIIMWLGIAGGIVGLSVPPEIALKII